MRLASVVVLTLVATGASAHADCASDAAALRHQLTREGHRADTWNTAWALGFGGAAAGQASMTTLRFNPTGPYDDAFEASLQVGALKAGLGMAARVALPLRIAIPSPSSDPCDDVRVLHRAVAKASAIERRSVWLALIGAAAVNLAGSIYLWAKHDFATGALSFATGAPIGLLSAATQPREMIRLRKRVAWSVGLGSVGATF